MTKRGLPTAGSAVMLTKAEQSLPTEGLPAAGCAVMLMRAEQSLPTAGSNATKQACVVLLQEMKFDHQDQKQACWPPMPGTRPHMLRSICGRIDSLTLCTFCFCVDLQSVPTTSLSTRSGINSNAHARKGGEGDRQATRPPTVCNISWSNFNSVSIWKGG